MPRKCQLPQAATSALAGAPGGRGRALSAVVAPRLCQGGVSDPGKDPSAVSGWDESPGGADQGALCGTRLWPTPPQPPQGVPAVPPHPGGSLGPPSSPPHRGAARLPWGHWGLSRASPPLPAFLSHLFPPLLPGPRPWPGWWPLPSCCSWRCLLGPGMAWGCLAGRVCSAAVQPGPPPPPAQVPM